MIRVVVDSIRVSLLTQHRVVVLRDSDAQRYIPIWIGPFEADAIAMALQGHEPQRPLTHDLLRNVIADLGATINHILISDLQDSTFFARIVVEQEGNTIEIDSRPSDALALAVRIEVPIYVAEHVFDTASISIDDATGEALDSSAENRSSDDAPRASSSYISPEEMDEMEHEEGTGSLTTESDIFRSFIQSLDRKPGGKEPPSQS